MLKFIVLSSFTVLVGFSDLRSTHAQEPGHSYASEELAKLTAAGIRQKLDRLSQGNYEQRSWDQFLRPFVQSTLAVYEGGIPLSKSTNLVERSADKNASSDTVALEILNLLVKPNTSSADIYRFIQLTSNHRVHSENLMALLGSKLKIFSPRTESRDQGQEYLVALSQFASAFRQQFPWGETRYNSTDAQRFFESEATRVMNELLPEAEVRREFYLSMASADPENASLYEGIYYRSLGIDTTQPINQLLLPRGSVSLEDTDTIPSLLYHHSDLTPAQAREGLQRICDSSKQCRGWALFQLFSQIIKHFSTRDGSAKKDLRELFTELRSAVKRLNLGLRHDAERQLARAFEPYFAEMTHALPKADFLRLLGQFINLAPDAKGGLALKYRSAKPAEIEIERMLEPTNSRMAAGLRNSREYQLWKELPDHASDIFSRLVGMALLERAGFRLSKEREGLGALLRRSLLAEINAQGGLKASPRLLELIFTLGHFDRELVVASAGLSRRSHGATKSETPNYIFFWPKNIFGPAPENIAHRLASLVEIKHRKTTGFSGACRFLLSQFRADRSSILFPAQSPRAALRD